MKSPLMYLTAVKLKNQLKEAVKHPAKLIYIIFIAAALVLSTIGGQTNAEHLELRPLQELTAIMVLFYSLMFLITFINGVNGGAGNYPMFTLSDVSVLFPSAGALAAAGILPAVPVQLDAWALWGGIWAPDIHCFGLWA